MSTQKVPLEALTKVRQYIKSALTLSDSEDQPKVLAIEEPPVPGSLDQLGDLFHFGGTPEETLQIPNSRGQWFISAMNPGAVFLKLPGLTLKPDFRLVSYLYRLSEADGKGIVWALPESLSTTAQLQKALTSSVGSDHPPKPEGAIANFMDAIAGDGSPMSYVIASLLRRELLEFGAFGKSTNWNHHRLMDTLPTQTQWQWRTEVKDLSPKVAVFPNGKIAVEFFTCRLVAPVAIFQHVDQYEAGQYSAKSLDRAIAQLQKMPAKVK